MIPLHDDNPTDLTPVVTVAFMVLCILVFAWQLTLGEHGQRAILQFGVIPAVLLGDARLAPDLVAVPAWGTVFTSMFMHGGWMHLIGNMLYLWIFGNNVEDAMGHGRFVLFYMLCGIAAVYAQVLPDPESTIPMIGASGAISGVLGAYLLLYPRARVLVVIPLGIVVYPLRIPAAIVLLLWFGMQLVSSWVSGDQQGGVAFGAHIGGFIMGVALIPFFRKPDKPLHLPGRTF